MCVHPNPQNAVHVQPPCMCPYLHMHMWPPACAMPPMHAHVAALHMPHPTPMHARVLPACTPTPVHCTCSPCTCPTLTHVWQRPDNQLAGGRHAHMHSEAELGPRLTPHREGVVCNLWHTYQKFAITVLGPSRVNSCPFA